jgi:UDP-N-acetylmuramate--alanine ligase
MLLDKMTLKNKQLLQKTDLLNELKTRSPEVLLTMGAGDIDTMIEPIKSLLTH